ARKSPDVLREDVPDDVRALRETDQHDLFGVALALDHCPQVVSTPVLGVEVQRAFPRDRGGRVLEPVVVVVHAAGSRLSLQGIVDWNAQPPHVAGRIPGSPNRDELDGVASVLVRRPSGRTAASPAARESWTAGRVRTVGG